MSFQILEIVLYSNTGKTRILPLRTNSVNIITGASKTGKSAILHIVSYCLGDKKSNIPEGVILEKTSWFAVHLIREEEELFVARRNPGPGKLSSEDIYIEKGSKLQVPDYRKLTQNSNRDTLITLLNQFAGISDYSFEKKPGQTRNTGVADIGKALIYCFQEQGEIANQRLLFHRQGEQFLPQSIKDYMPFFLGAIDRDHVLKKEEVRRLKQELRRLESNNSEQERMRGTFFERAHSLIAEAVSVYLLSTKQEMPHSWQEVKEVLTAAINAKAEQTFPETQYALELEKLFGLQGDLRNKHRAISEEMAALRALKSGGQGFAHEATEQRTRLSSIGLLPAGEESISSVCPLCSSTLSTPAPNAEAIRANLKVIMHHLEGVSSDFPHIDKLIANAEAKQAEINAELRNLNSRILAIQNVNKRIEVIRDSNAKRALIQGRLGLYLETISDVKDAAEDSKEIELLRSRIQALELSLADETLQERLDSVLSLLSNEMSDMACTLDLEHSIYPMRLDTNKLTVVADTESGPLPLERMGSGENWVSLHIITYLVLHRWFARKGLPVPNFIFFDQPTQAYFPPDVSDETVRNTDRESVIRMFRLISDKVKDAGFQVIVMEHADIQEDWYQMMIAEKWWDGVKKLVPLDWMNGV